MNRLKRWLLGIMSLLVLGLGIGMFNVEITADVAHESGYDTIQDKEIEVTRTEKDDIAKAFKFIEENKESIAELMGEPQITNEEIIITEKDMEGILINFGTDKVIPKYPYYRVINGVIYSGILELVDQKTQDQNGGKLFKQEIITIEKKE